MREIKGWQRLTYLLLIFWVLSLGLLIYETNKAEKEIATQGGDMSDLRIYGKWDGNPNGTKENVTCCIAKVVPLTGFPIPRQCYRKRGRGPGGLYCTQHGKIEEVL
ncbi:hypothetical protein LCGC14_1155350 [marine sediment metagenome]|uniref:Uncharacterized protein n=1 Tax=marine sediment metagenome TaxID=412755 RepID=A0A0F9LU68_9ZZZZ